MFTFQEMQDFADWYCNFISNRERSKLGLQGAFDKWFSEYSKK